MTSKRPDRRIIYWLYTGMILTYMMVAIGGITRLTDSGLSMVNWSPIMGTLPPLSIDEWQETFDAYKASPEFVELNYDFGLDEFKSIFWWEYIHRSLGRLIGLVFFIPFCFFLFTKKLTKKLVKQLVVVFIMGGLQGLLGWYMVKSGLINEPRVSHYRLAAHLITAFATISYLWWIIGGIREPANEAKGNKVIHSFLIAFLAVTSLQIIYGAFVAGLDAGLVHNTWPLMDGYAVHPAVGVFDSFWMNVLENRSGVQFVHRSMAIVVLAIGLYLGFRNWDGMTPRQRGILTIIGYVVVGQFTLGVLTLMFAVPLWLGVLHQLGALTLLLAIVSGIRKMRTTAS